MFILGLFIVALLKGAFSANETCIKELRWECNNHRMLPNEFPGTEDEFKKSCSFKWKTMSGKMCVYDIANIANDPEMGKFWLLYVGETNNTNSFIHLTTGPDELILKTEDHLVFWYKTASV